MKTYDRDWKTFNLAGFPTKPSIRDRHHKKKEVLILEIEFERKLSREVSRKKPRKLLAIISKVATNQLWNVGKL